MQTVVCSQLRTMVGKMQMVTKVCRVLSLLRYIFVPLVVKENAYHILIFIYEIERQNDYN